MKFYNCKCRVLHLRRNNPLHQYRLGLTCCGKQLCGDGPGSHGGQQVDHEPAVFPGCQEGHGILGFMKKSVASSLREFFPTSTLP